jgi:hypothetical protein
MLDLLLANNLLKALQPGTHLLLVGDVDQLPSVGAGDVLRDVIASGIAPVTRLSAIFRQAAGSQIITNAHRVNQGKLPVFPPSGEGGDCFLFPAETAEEAARWVQEVVCQRIPARFGLHPRLQVQVLAPMYRGPAGVTALNESLQAALNPPAPNKPEKSLFWQIFRLGDKVMQLQNNYDKECLQRGHRDGSGVDPSINSWRLISKGGGGYGRCRSAGAGLRRFGAQSPGLGIPRRGHPPGNRPLHDAAAQPALHGCHPRQAVVRAGGSRRAIVAWRCATTR